MFSCFIRFFRSCNHPKLIEALRGKVIVDIAAGGSHTAAIGEHGELYTWGKGRYGRLGEYIQVMNCCGNHTFDRLVNTSPRIAI